MGWVIFAISAAVCWGLASFLMGVSTVEKLDPATTSLVNAFFATLVGGIWVFLEKSPHKITGIPLTFAALSGRSGGVAGIMFCKVIATGTSVSIGIAIVRVRMVVVATLLGAVFLKEGLSPRSLLGLILSLTGLYLLVGAK